MNIFKWIFEKDWLEKKLERLESMEKRFDSLEIDRDKAQNELCRIQSGLGLENPYKLICISKNWLPRLVAIAPSIDDINNKALVLCKENPLNVYVIFSPVSVYKAEIPVEMKPWEDNKST